jgi:GAF domain-containing protein
MAEDLIISGKTKTERYEALMPQIKALIAGESNQIANLGNICAALKETFDFFWVGFYIVRGKELVLGPFQGPVACTRISHGRGVCGTAWAKNETQLVPNVDLFPGHIACSSLSKSEVVIPIAKSGKVLAILDVDSKTLNDFDATDVQYLTEICEWASDSF